MTQCDIKPGMRVVKQDGTCFSNGNFEVEVDRIENCGKLAWLKETGTNVSTKDLMPAKQGASDILPVNFTIHGVLTGWKADPTKARAILETMKNRVSGYAGGVVVKATITEEITI